MNDYIKELKEQARDFYLNQEDLDWSPQELHNAVEEKFAELLIRDVTETAAKYRQSKTRPVGWNFRATILDHYGLKEEK